MTRILIAICSAALGLLAGLTLSLLLPDRQPGPTPTTHIATPAPVPIAAPPQLAPPDLGCTEKRMLAALRSRGHTIQPTYTTTPSGETFVTTDVHDVDVLFTYGLREGRVDCANILIVNAEDSEDKHRRAAITFMKDAVMFFSPTWKDPLGWVAQAASAARGGLLITTEQGALSYELSVGHIAEVVSIEISVRPSRAAFEKAIETR